MTDEEDYLRYDKMVETALRGVVRQAVEEVIENYNTTGGMPGDHHFYITFLTDYPGVKIPDYLKERYPGEMTIVLQYQFSDLKVDDERMEVTLSFNNVPERLVVPLNSISIFADPSVNFALQFQPLGDVLEDEDLILQEMEDDDNGDDPDGTGGGSSSGKTGEVVSLDNFRKKQDFKMTLWVPEKAFNPEPYRVLLKRGEFIDESRDGRAVPYKIYYPEGHDLEKMPIIIWSHGFGGNRDGASFISRFLAGQGYTLVHITHHGTDSSLWEGKEGHPWDILRQTKVPRETTLDRMYDVPFALDQLEEWARENPEVGQYMDFDRIGMSGHSFGAMTTQVMAGMKFPNQQGDALKSLRDDRLSCGILYSPVPIAHITDASPNDLYGSIEIPLFHMTGTDDQSPLENFGYEHRLIIRDHADHPEQYLQVLDDGDHMVYNGTRGKLKENPKREEHERLIIEGAFAFWEAYLKDDEAAKQWLQHHYMP